MGHVTAEQLKEPDLAVKRLRLSFWLSHEPQEKMFCRSSLLNACHQTLPSHFQGEVHGKILQRLRGANPLQKKLCQAEFRLLIVRRIGEVSLKKHSEIVVVSAVERPARFDESALSRLGRLILPGQLALRDGSPLFCGVGGDLFYDLRNHTKRASVTLQEPTGTQFRDQGRGTIAGPVQGLQVSLELLSYLRLGQGSPYQRKVL